MKLSERRFKAKTWGRIFVQHPDDVGRVVKIIKELDPFEAEYLPSGLVTHYQAPQAQLVYLHKFEIDMNLLIQTCIQRDIWIWCIDGEEEFPS